ATRFVSALRSTWASTTRTLAQADRSNIHAGTSSQRSASEPPQAAAKKRATRPLDRRVNADPKTKPRMPWVQQFSKLGSAGVLKLCCTTRSGLTPQSDTSHQHQRCSCLHSLRGRLRYADRL